MLMVEVLAKFRKTHGSESLLIEGVVIASAQKAVKAEDQKRLDSSLIRASHVGGVAGEFAGRRVTLSAKHSNSFDFGLACHRWQPFGKHAHDARVLSLAEISTHYVIVQDSFEFPTFLLRHLGEVFAAIQALLLPGDCQKNNRCRKFNFVRNSFA